LPTRRRELDAPGDAVAQHRVARIEAHADRPPGDRQLIGAPMRREQLAQTVDVDARHEEIRILRLETEQLVTHGAADDVRVQLERANVVLDGVHALVLTRGLLERDRFDLDERPRRQLRDLDRRPRGRGRADVLGVHLVHPEKVVEVPAERRSS